MRQSLQQLAIQYGHIALTQSMRETSANMSQEHAEERSMRRVYPTHRR
ncbi:hypothetical protein [Paenibacillus taiwanensis]|nr:hypothetical protein [Paenibacillus taiwanensis]